MFPITTILHPTDFSWYSQCAFQLACCLAREHGARVVVLYIVPASTPAILSRLEWESAPIDLDDFRDSLWSDLWHIESPEANVRIERRLEEGDAATEILRVAQEISADVIVMGTHECTGLANPPMKQVAKQIIPKATCPVVTLEVLPQVAGPSSVRYEELLPAPDLWVDVGGEG
jgi:nucleotide-binding universal stress UspA family protein